MKARLLHTSSFFALLFTLMGCSSIDLFKENTEIRPTKDYQTFVLVNQEINMQGFSDLYLDGFVQNLIQNKLEEHGLRYDREKPDLIIRYISNEDPRTREISNFNNLHPFWGYRVWDPWLFNPAFPNNRIREDHYELLQVIVDFIDSEEDKLLMTLTGVTEVGSPKAKKRKVLKTTDKIIERFIQETQNNHD